MKTPGFPTPVEGELYSSVVARYLQRTAGYTNRNLGIIGLARANAGAIVPIAVVKLAESMSEGHPWCNNPRQIVEKHTAVPLFLQSSSAEFYESTMEAISNGLNGNPSATLGLTKRSKNTNQYRSHNSKFCPDCVTQDIERFGFPVLYRQHQPEFVKYCARHSCPLHLSCVNCSTRTRAIMWRMAGQCDCQTPDTPMIVDTGIDKISKESLLWIAQQVDHLLQVDSHHTNINHTLRELLKSHSLITQAGRIKNSALISELEHEIGPELLYCFGFIVEHSRKDSSRHDLARIFRTNNNSTNIIYNLFVAKLFCDDVRELSKICESEKFLAHSPIKTQNQRQHLDKRLIQNSLTEAKEIVSRAAKNLGLSIDRFRTTARHHQIALPLSERQCNRIGWDLLQEIREALKNGMGYNEACRVFALGKYTTSLIFGDQPRLLLDGKTNKNNSKIQDAKEKLLALVESQPNITRSELRKTLSSSMNVVLINDSSWTSENIPITKRVKYNNATDKGDWKDRLQKIRLAAEAERKREFSKTERPTRLTPTRLRKDCGVAHPNSFPEPYKSEISNIFEAASESKNSFHDRLIEWAVTEYAKLLIPISSNKLRRIARLPIKDLLSCRELVIRHAQDHGLTYHSKCSLSPFISLHPPAKTQT
ncbi:MULTISPECIES: TnsD family Tn7-like transposition protein [Pseudomonas chlororaphis group]|uniref:TnsD family Tn7-like transposition protein n=1 Tax=Pseudomonas chlororaphis group TaxID=136842 RepID=UPI002096B7D9|nr:MULTISPECIES: TnsD family Tn7-like transposition protein [Pseudomonas chlororaphis group]MCO7578251.1 TniQ family protein [Pseudomonas protegens]MCO7584612.1 TniQ family protein [Pseudomonas chlororaphis]MCO7601337.1 TniQ family protein [Pseudomonas chlororaphis]